MISNLENYYERGWWSYFYILFLSTVLKMSPSRLANEDRKMLWKQHPTIFQVTTSCCIPLRPVKMTIRIGYTWRRLALNSQMWLWSPDLWGLALWGTLSRSSQGLTSPLRTAGSWLLSEGGCTTGRAVGFTAMSCTDPEVTSKGSVVALPLSKRTTPSSSSLAGTEAHRHILNLWWGCPILGGNL